MDTTRTAQPTDDSMIDSALERIRSLSLEEQSAAFEQLRTQLERTLTHTSTQRPLGD